MKKFNSAGRFPSPIRFFNEERLLQKIKDKVSDKPFGKKFKPYKKIAVYLSYLFALISAAGLIFGVYYMSNLIFNNPYFAIAIAVVFAFFFEKLKRMSSEEFWQFFWFKQKFSWTWFALSISIFVVSLMATPYGTKKGTNELSAPPEIVAADNEAIDYQRKVDDLKLENQTLSQNKNSAGEIYWPSQKSMEVNTNTMADYEKEIRRLNTKTEEFRDVLTADHKVEVDMTGWIFVGITVLFEFLFEFCVCFIWYYYARVLWEQDDTSTSTLPDFSWKEFEKMERKYEKASLIMQSTIKALEAKNATLQLQLKTKNVKQKKKKAKANPATDNVRRIGFKMNNDNDSSKHNDNENNDKNGVITPLQPDNDNENKVELGKSKPITKTKKPKVVTNITDSITNDGIRYHKKDGRVFITHKGRSGDANYDIVAVKSNINTYNSKLKNGVGKEETNTRNLTLWNRYRDIITAVEAGKNPNLSIPKNEQS